MIVLKGTYMPLSEWRVAEGLSPATARRRAVALSEQIADDGHPNAVKIAETWLVRVGP